MGHKLEFDEVKHRYTLDGENMPSVTTILGAGFPKPYLMYWAAKMVAEAAVDEAENIARTLEVRGGDARGDLINRLKSAPWRYRDSKARKGTAVHSLAEQLVNWEEIEPAPELRPYLDAYLMWLDDNPSFEVIATEVPLASTMHGYAGTADLIAKFEGDVWLFDLKTSNSVHGEYFMQCAAYANADYYKGPDGKLHPMIPVDCIGVIHLTPHEATLYRGPEIRDAWKAFLAVKAVADQVKNINSWVSTKKDKKGSKK